MRTDLRLATTRRSFLLAFLGLFFPLPRRPAATRMTMADWRDWPWQWCRALAGPGLPAA